MSTISTSIPTPAVRQRTFTGARVILVVTAATFLFHVVTEIIHAVQLPQLRPDLLGNVVLVFVWSAAGALVALGFVRLGRSVPTVMAWIMTVLAMATAMPLFWSSIPASLAAGAFALPPSSSPGRRAAQVLAVITLVAYVAISIGVLVKDGV